MASTKIDSADITDFSSLFSDISFSSQEPLSTYQNTEWATQLGFYKEISELAGMIDRKAQYVVGKGYKLKGIFTAKTKKRLNEIKGNGLDTFDTILYNAVRTYTIGGDFYAEIIKDSKGNLINLKPLNPGKVKVYSNKKGMVVRYEVFSDDSKKSGKPFEPGSIFHLAYNRLIDEIHGQSLIKKLEPIIKMRKEAMDDLRVIFHRYVKPLWVFSVDTDDTTEILNFKNKVDSTIDKAENLVVPKGTVSNIERIAIPQFSTLDPLPWIKLLQLEFIKAEGVPGIVLGVGGEATEAESKILYLSWQQIVEFNQKFLEEQINNQLGINIELEFPTSIAPDLIQDNQTDNSSSRLNKNDVTPGKDNK